MNTLGFDESEKAVMKDAIFISEFKDTFPEDYCEGRIGWDGLYDEFCKLKDGFDLLVHKSGIKKDQFR